MVNLFNIQLLGVPSEESERNVPEATTEKEIAEDFPGLRNAIHPQIESAH